MTPTDFQPTTFGNTVYALLFNEPLGVLNVSLEKNRLTANVGHNFEWSNVASDITSSLENAGIEYVLMKVFCVPNVFMEDLDLLIEDEQQIRDTLNILKAKNFSFYRDRFSRNPLKITCITRKKNIQVDIYPESTWFNMRYAPDLFVTSSRVRRKFWETEAFAPSPTIDFYIVATHSYNHGFISLAEIGHAVRLVCENKIDWELLGKLSFMFKLDHALILFLRIVQLSLLSRKIDRGMLLLSDIILQRDALARIYSNWILTNSHKGFPIVLPYRIRGMSSFRRILRPSLNTYTKVYDELSGYTLALLFRGDRRRVI